MAEWVALKEMRCENPITWWKSSVVCTKWCEGTFSLQLRICGDLGSYRDPSILRFRSPKKFVEGLFSLTDWSELKFDREEIASEICTRLSELDKEFADAVADYVKSDHGNRH